MKSRRSFFKSIGAAIVASAFVPRLLLMPKMEAIAAVPFQGETLSGEAAKAFVRGIFFGDPIPDHLKQQMPLAKSALLEYIGHSGLDYYEEASK